MRIFLTSPLVDICLFNFTLRPRQSTQSLKISEDTRGERKKKGRRRKAADNQRRLRRKVANARTKKDALTMGRRCDSNLLLEYIHASPTARRGKKSPWRTHEDDGDDELCAQVALNGIRELLSRGDRRPTINNAVHEGIMMRDDGGLYTLVKPLSALDEVLARSGLICTAVSTRGVCWVSVDECDRVVWGIVITSVWIGRQ